MPLYLRIDGRDIPMNLKYDNREDLKHSKDFPEEFFLMFEEKGKLVIEFCTSSNNRKEIRTPNGRTYY